MKPEEREVIFIHVHRSDREQTVLVNGVERVIPAGVDGEIIKSSDLDPVR